MDLKHFKLESEAEDSYHVTSPRGKKFTIEKKGLNPKAHEMIKKMCSGGSVQKFDEGGIPVGQNTVLAPEPAPGPDLSANVQVPSAPPQIAPTPQAPNDPLVQNRIDTGNLLDQEEQAAKTYAGGADKANQMTQKAYQDEIDQLKQMQTPQDIANSYKQKDDALMQNYMNNKIDPNRYVQNMSTGSKILAGIGMALSGAGAGRNGTNLAVQQFNNAINNDIAAQQNDQSKSLNLYKMNRDAMKDDQQALIATQNQMLTGVQAKVAQAAAQSQNADSHFKASQLVNQIEQQKVQNRLRLGLLTQGGGGSSGANPLNLVPDMVPAEHQKQAITEIGQAQAAKENEGNILNLFDQAAKQTRPVSGGFSDTSLMNTLPGYQPPAIKALNLLYDPLIHDNEGRINELEQKHVQSISPQFGDSDNTVRDKRAALQEFINHKKSAPTAATFGINMNNFSSTKSTTPPSQISYKDGIPYQKVPGGWQRVSK